MQKNCLTETLLSIWLLRNCTVLRKLDCLFHRRHPYFPSQAFSVLASCIGHERQRGLSWVNVHWTSYAAGDPNTPWGCPGMHAHEDVQMLLQSILLLKTLVLSRHLNIFLKCNRPFLKEPGARRDAWNHLIPCLWDEEVRPRKTWHKCLSNHRRALELSHMVIQTSQSKFWTPRTVTILPLCV